jgi:hypothetical protein
MPLAKSRTFGVRLILPQWILVPGFHIDLTDDLSILDSSDDMFENVFAVWESTVDAERYPIRGDQFIGYGNVEVRTAHPLRKSAIWCLPIIRLGLVAVRYYDILSIRLLRRRRATNGRDLCPRRLP